jgi:hypothetical protein
VSRVRFLFDEDFNGRIVRGCRRRLPRADTRTVREAGLEGADDPIVLKWAATDRRVVVSHGRRTMTAAARSRIREGLPMAGLVLFRQDCSVAVAVDELELVYEVSRAEEWYDVIAFLPI